jgi:beta-lactamase class A
MKFISQRNIILLLAILLAVSVTWNIVEFIKCKHAEDENIALKLKPEFNLLSPSIAWMESEEFLKIQKNYSVSYLELRKRLADVQKNSGSKRNYGVYFEDLNTGAWIGINEKEEFVPGSLVKIPAMVAVLKKVENKAVSLDKEITLDKNDINLTYGTLGLKGAGYKITVRDLLTCLIKESDNTALIALHRHVITSEEFIDALLAMGLILKKDNVGYATVSPKHYSNILRSLYYSSYLRRPFSQLCLSILSDTNYNSQLPAGIPAGIPISHKIGEYRSTTGEIGYNDCGIIYYPNQPYILCVMSRNTTKFEADKYISEISKVTYNYIDEHNQGD